MLDVKAVEEMVELILIFGRQNAERAGETEAEIIHAGAGFAGFGSGAGGVLSVLLVGG